ncbi:MAG: hypothetical protein HC902_10710 [Calothrix sp. SM1_5_4]|nr:hypothetical protein [Calothrix sp. SM1_5_4]
MQDGAFYIKRAGKIGPFTAQLVEMILASGQGFVDTRKVWGILSLDKSHAPEKIEKAAKMALDLGDLSYRRVEAILRLTPTDKAEPAEAKQTAHKFVRDLNEYKKLLSEQKEVQHEPSVT